MEAEGEMVNDKDKAAPFYVFHIKTGQTVRKLLVFDIIRYFGTLAGTLQRFLQKSLLSIGFSSLGRPGGLVRSIRWEVLLHLKKSTQ